MTRQEMREFAQKQVEFAKRQIAFNKGQIEWTNRQLERTRKEDREQKEWAKTYNNGEYAHLYEGRYQGEETRKYLNERRRWQRDLKHYEAELVHWTKEVEKYTDHEEIKEEETMTTNTQTTITEAPKTSAAATNAFINYLLKKGFLVVKLDTNTSECYRATLTETSGHYTIGIFFGGNAAKITGRIIKVNGSSKWYYEKTLAQMLAIVRQCMEGYNWPTPEAKPTKTEIIEAMDDDAEDPSVTLGEFIDTAKATNNEEEETTMKTTTSNPITLDLVGGIVRFELNDTTYTYNIETKRYAKITPDGKTKRIGKAEYDEAKVAYDQKVLDDQPSRVEVENDLDKPAVLNENGLVDCSKCNCDKCVHRNCMRRNPRNVGGLGECPRLDNGIMGEGQKIAEEEGIELAEAELEANIRNEQKKPRKARKSKDVAYEGHGVTLTAKQVDFLLDLKQTDQWDGFDTMFWTDVICDEIEGQFAGKPMTVGAMISTLCEKGLAERSKGEFTDPVTNRTRKSTYMAFTGLGEEIAKELGL